MRIFVVFSFFAVVLACAQIGEASLLPTRDVCGKQTITGDAPSAGSAGKNEFPWLALIQFEKENGETSFYCVGSLINQRYVLTTGFCAEPSNRIKLIGVRLGVHNIREEGEEGVVDVAVDEVTAHARSNDSSDKEHEIALIRLKNDVTFTDSIRPICLPLADTNLPKVGDILYTSGWADSSRKGQFREIKKKAEQQLISNEDCAENLQNRIVITEKLVCTLDKGDEGACTGDGGGPLMYEDGGHWYQYGIVSFGPNSGCTNGSTEGYTKVPGYLSWVEENLRD